jgi:hypothetical protein
MTRKWKKAESPKKIATANPTGVLRRVIGSANMLPGGPAIYRATMGSEKSFARIRTTTICAKWNKPAMRL